MSHNRPGECPPAGTGTLLNVEELARRHRAGGAQGDQVRLLLQARRDHERLAELGAEHLVDEGDDGTPYALKRLRC